VSESTIPVQPVAKWRARLGWIAPLALALLVVCTGCFMMFAFALSAQGELEVSLLGSDWRVWQLIERGTNGVGLSQTHATASEPGRACQATTIWLITWRPRVNIERIEDVSCDALRLNPPVARPPRSIIIALSRGRP
jgi:hypothetical protein